MLTPGFLAITTDRLADFECYLASPPAARLIASGHILRCAPVDGFRREMLVAGRRDVALLLEQERVPFFSYPSEWPPEMLHAAASLTFDLARIFQAHHIGLRGATPDNVHFRGARPVFAGIPAFERRNSDGISENFTRQFVEAFLRPLAAARRLSWFDRWRFGWAGIEKRLALVAPRTNRTPGKPPPPDSCQFVRDALVGYSPSRVLDIGCGTGHFSVLAAQAGAEVTAIDADFAAVGVLWRRALFENLPILPLVANPESPSFQARARGHFDAVLLQGNVTDRLLDLAAEFVSAAVAGIVVAEVPHAVAAFRHFAVVRAQTDAGGRKWLYLLRRKPGTDNLCIRPLR